MKTIARAALLLALLLPHPAAAAETAYDRVVRTRTLRCGYNYYEPAIWRDGKTSEMKGAFVEYMDALAKITGLKVEWTQEVGWGDVPVALAAQKVDAMCAGVWADAKRGLQTAFTKPAYYNLIEVYARADDHRFDKDLSLINDPSVTIAVIDNGQAADIADKDFPKAKTVAVPALGTDADVLLNVATKKADVTFTNHGPASGFMKQNPGKLRRVAADRPLRVFGVTTAVDIHEQELLTFLDTATAQLVDSGTVDRILAKYEKDYPGSFTKAAKSYEPAQ